MGLSLTLENMKHTTSGLIKRIFRLKTVPVPGSDDIPEERIITHLQAVCWEDDNAITDSSHFEDLDKIIKFIKKHRTAVEITPGMPPQNPPNTIIIHCSAGIGRTGTLTAIYAIIEAIEWLHRYSATSFSTEALLQAGCSLEDIKIIEKDFPALRTPRISVFGTVRKMRE